MCPGEGDTGGEYSEGEPLGDTLRVLVRGEGTLTEGSERELSLSDMHSMCVEEFRPLNIKCYRHPTAGVT